MALWPSRSLPPDPASGAEVLYLQHAPLRRVDKRFLSWSIDISVFAGGLWWEGAGRARRGVGTLPVPPLSLDSKGLDRLVSALGPAYLRIGGSEADRIHYFEAPPDEEGGLVLSRSRWDALQAFIARHDLGLIFTCKYGLFRRSEHGSWDGSELERLLQHACERGQRIDVFELGNELNAYWAFHGLRAQPGARSLARDYDRFAELVRQYYPEARISGPGSAFWPRLGETFRPFTRITPRFLASLQQSLDIVDWHYYPFQSERSPLRTRSARLEAMLDPRALDDFGRYSQQLSRLRDRFQPGAELWTGETGSAQCGGQPFLSDRWASSFWWADQLGQGAALGQRVMVRQALIGGDYGMIDRLTLKPRPDYWVSWLWQRLMGQRVFRVRSSDPYLRAYLHERPDADGKTLMLINLHGEPLPVSLRGFGEPLGAYTLTAKHPTARKIRINGLKPRLHKGRLTLTDIPVVPLPSTLPPHSITFCLLPG
ncbi:glycoside hydrolase [Parahaliea maris]|uniref:Glycoside hydrolase n=1 Tax=Parahaliea maris TaxID=2716870 RepID=A0A5C9A3M1_9GAMM|nr:glycoside hydrolase [Parahaliea maris]TXS95368.1 glycoside hydrolase [Parahaliea maris]